VAALPDPAGGAALSQDCGKNSNVPDPETVALTTVGRIFPAYLALRLARTCAKFVKSL
jgi:hypothetical protein